MEGRLAVPASQPQEKIAQHFDRVAAQMSKTIVRLALEKMQGPSISTFSFDFRGREFHIKQQIGTSDSQTVEEWDESVTNFSAEGWSLEEGSPTVSPAADRTFSSPLMFERSFLNVGASPTPSAVMVTPRSVKLDNDYFKEKFSALQPLLQAKVAEMLDKELTKASFQRKVEWIRNVQARGAPQEILFPKLKISFTQSTPALEHRRVLRAAEASKEDPGIFTLRNGALLIAALVIARYALKFFFRPAIGR